MSGLLAAVVDPPPAVSFAGPAQWWASHLLRTSGYEQPIDRAIVGALGVDRVAWAFAGGYVAALQQLIPSLPRDTFASLAATEEGGAHPRAIQTSFDGQRLVGTKRWVTLPGDEKSAANFFVVAQVPGAQADGRPKLVLVRVRSDAPGLEIRRTFAPMVPELAHAELQIDVSVALEDVLPGDGYADYLKPFRTVEDLHVQGALAAMVLGLAHRLNAPRPARERLIAALVAIRALALSDPKSTAVHLALAGVIAVVDAAIREIEPSFVELDPETHQAWERDRVLFAVAAKARAARLEAAWTRGAR